LEAANLIRFHLAYERRVFDSIERFAAIPQDVRDAARVDLDLMERLARREDAMPAGAGPDGNPSSSLVYTRSPEPKGPMTGFGYDYFEDRAGRAGLGRPALQDWKGAWGAGEEYAYEALNLVDGSRTVSGIRDDLAAIYGPVPLELVEEYLRALETTGILRRDQP
jgi:hypothetical protein